MQHPSVQELVRELVSLEPSFVGQEQELTLIVQKLLDARLPDVPNAEFVQQLKRQILTLHSPTRRMTRNQLLIPAGAFAMVLMLAVIVSTSTPGSWFPTGTQSDSVRITRVQDEAFGSFAQSTGPSPAVLGTPEAISARPSAAPTRMPSALDSTGTTMNMTPGNAGGGVTVDQKMIAYPPQDYVVYTYRYAGEMPSLNEAQVAVLRRVRNGFGTSAVNSLLSATGGLMDLGSFGNARLQNFTLTQDVPYGYMVTVDAREGMISINQNYEQWPRMDYSKPLTASEQLTDAELIRIANDFLQSFGVARGAYGEPVVQRPWNYGDPRIMEMQSAPGSAVSESLLYIPESVTVMYPQVIDGIMVVDESGNAQGMGVNVNLRTKRVESVWNLSTQQYESSQYAGVTDAATVEQVLARGGMYGYVPETGVKTQQLAVGAPIRVLMRTWMPSADGMSGSDVLVPALQFAITDNDRAALYGRQGVVVPLVADLLKQTSGGNVTPMPATTMLYQVR